MTCIVRASSETQLRREFLDRFFEAVGWGVFNKQSYAETYKKDIIHEDSLGIEGENKAPDYAFRVGANASFLWKPRSQPSKLNRIFILLFSCGSMPGLPSCRWVFSRILKSLRSIISHSSNQLLQPYQQSSA